MDAVHTSRSIWERFRYVGGICFGFSRCRCEIPIWDWSIRAHIQDQTDPSNLEIQRIRILSLKKRMVRILDDIVESVIWLSI